jgi:hypothetical protein
MLLHGLPLHFGDRIPKKQDSEERQIIDAAGLDQQNFAPGTGAGGRRELCG